MYAFWWRGLAFPIGLLVFCLLVWALAGALAALFLFGVVLLLWVMLQLRQLAILVHWLENAEQRSLPDSGLGMWEEVFAHMKKMTRLQRKEREKHTAALRHMEQATSALPEGVAILDHSDRVEWCNPLAGRHFGLDEVRDIGQQITYLVRQPEFVQYLAARDYREPLVLHGARNEGLILSIKLIPYGDDKRLLISRDITSFERIETVRRDFVANVSHELRTPLTVVNGFVETLRDMPSLENDMARRALELMGTQTQRMTHLVDDLLTLSKLDNSLNVLKEEQVNMPDMMHSLLQEGRSLSEGKHDIEMELGSQDGLLASTEELRSAFGNLVSNAVRYTPKGGRIVLGWNERNGQMMFSVQDSGIGIASQHIPRLTERFYRVDNSRSRETGGTGLGLAIVKHVVNRHQAQMEVTSEEGKGSRFTIVFPLSRRLPAKADAPEPAG